MKVWDYYIRKFDPTLVEWIEGILAGCKKKGVDAGYLDLLAVTVYPAEMWQRPKIPYPKETRVQAAEKRALLGANIDNYEYHSCNAFTATGAATGDGKPVVALSKMVPMEAMPQPLIGGFSQEWTKLRDKPLCGRDGTEFRNEQQRFRLDHDRHKSEDPSWGLQSEAIFHYLTEIARSPAEAQEYLKSVPRAGVTGSFTPLGDAAGNISVFETEMPTIL